MAESNITTQKVTTSISLILSLWGSFKYLVLRKNGLDNSNPFHIDNTPFTGNYFVIVVFWVILFFLQVSFVAQFFFPDSNSAAGGLSIGNGSSNISIGNGLTRSRYDITSVIGWHFTIFNFLHFGWTYFFFKHHWFISELLLIINFFNIISLYFVHKTYQIKPVKYWSLIHLSTAAFPFSWVLYAIFWNGAVLFHVHGLLGRVLANVLIWDFLIVPLFFLVVYNDYGVGFSSSILLFGLGLGQLFTKVIALQWIFAFVISGVLFLASLVAATTGSLHPKHRSGDYEQAPLLAGH